MNIPSKLLSLEATLAANAQTTAKKMRDATRCAGGAEADLGPGLAGHVSCGPRVAVGRGRHHAVVLQEVARKTEDHKETFLLRGKQTGNIYVVEATTGSSDLLEETGVEIHGTLNAPHPAEDKKPMIYLGRLLERPASKTLVMELLGVYTAGPVLVDISR